MNKDNKKTELDNTDKKLHISDVMCRFNEMTIDKLKSKLSRTWIEETTNTGQFIDNISQKNK